MKNRGFPSISTPTICTLIAFSVTVSGQTQVDISKQGKNVDFTGAPYTRPVKTGTSLPGTCSMGDMFLNMSAAAGRNLYACTAANTWTVQAAAANSGLPDPGTNGIVVRTALNQDTAVPAPNGTVVGTSDTQTLTNKSIDASEINSGVLPGARMPAFSGDISSTAGGTTATLATVNSTPGTFGGASSIPVITVNGKGLITGISTVTAAAGTGTVGGGTGASSVAMQTSDLAVTGTGTTITSGASCSSSTPCLIYINGIRYPFTGSSSLSISGSGSETIWHYVDPNNGGKETWGYPSGSQNTYTASGTAVVTSGITAVPADAYPLAVHRDNRVGHFLY